MKPQLFETNNTAFAAFLAATKNLEYHSVTVRKDNKVYWQFLDPDNKGSDLLTAYRNGAPVNATRYEFILRKFREIVREHLPAIKESNQKLAEIHRNANCSKDGDRNVSGVR